MGNSRALEVIVVLLLIAGAVIFQFFSKPSESSEAGTDIKADVNVGIDPPVEEKVEKLAEPLKAAIESEKVKEAYRSIPLPKFDQYISSLGEKPNWDELNAYQRTLTRDEFMQLLSDVYTVSDSWKELIHVRRDRVEIRKSTERPRDGVFKLFFKSANDRRERPIKRYWRPASELTKLDKVNAEKPLDGVVIAIDPGHIGGDEWARIEERDFALAGDNPVREGEITLKVAMMLMPELEELGAVVSLVRESLEPVNHYRPEDYRERAVVQLKASGKIVSEATVAELSEKLFYRTGEIIERAKLINRAIKPDIVLCLHFNATNWGAEGEDKVLADGSHLHLILHGAYTDYEVRLDDERFAMIKKIVTKSHEEEAAISNAVAASSAKNMQLPPYLYEPNSNRALKVNGNPYLWARNLLANRAYDCPVVYMEPYVMNSKFDYARLQLGDYDGEKEVGGEMRISIFREYVKSLTEGLSEYYSAARIQENGEK
ncbi:N-acetylmuramoyl-L-alanine amidase [Akkermansiaceae bacterium]|nr:N-acetylmuramoyl-L-alanine amidase [Akkermansiaceae bacterium]